MKTGFTFSIMDVNETESDRIIELSTPQDIFDIAALLRDTERYVIESIRINSSNDTVAVASTSRLHNMPQGFFGAAMLPISELEYTGITERLDELSSQFQSR